MYTVREITPSLPVGALADGDVLFATEELKGFYSRPGIAAMLKSVIVVDDDDNGIALELIFFRSNVALGTEDSAVSLADGDADEIVAVVEVATGDYVNTINNQVAHVNNLDRIMKPLLNGDMSVWVAGITRGGTPTYTAAGLTFKFGLDLG